MSQTRKLPEMLPGEEELQYGERRVRGRDPACTAGTEEGSELGNDSSHLWSALEVGEASWRTGREEKRDQGRGRRGRRGVGGRDRFLNRRGNRTAPLS